MTLPMRHPSAIPNPLQAHRNDVRLAFGIGEGNHDVIRPALLPEVGPVDREHIAHGFNVGALLRVAPKHDEILLSVHGNKKFARNSLRTLANVCEQLRIQGDNGESDMKRRAFPWMQSMDSPKDAPTCLIAKIRQESHAIVLAMKVKGGCYADSW